MSMENIGSMPTNLKLKNKPVGNNPEDLAIPKAGSLQMAMVLIGTLLTDKNSQAANMANFLTSLSKCLDIVAMAIRMPVSEDRIFMPI